MLPAGFLAEISRHAELAPLAQSLLEPPAVSVRVNPAKGQTARGEQVPWCADGCYLDERPRFTFDPAMHQGLYYVQDASSMAIAAVVRELADGRPQRYLDACAAPGGKTTAAISALPEGSFVLANEYDFRRAEILAENVAKWGSPDCAVSRGDTRRLAKLKGMFDIVAVDAPCSGEGMMRKDPQAVEQWSPALVSQCAATQREILANVWQALRPGGYLIYSTCTFNLQENEENLAWLVDEFDAEPVTVNALEPYAEICHGIGTTLPCYRFLPGRVRGEGLFLAVVRKLQNVGLRHSAASTKAKPVQPRPEAKWLQDSDWRLSPKGDDLYAVRECHAPILAEMEKALDLISPGLRVATIKGRDAIPSQELALSTALAPDAFPRCEVDRSTAIAYLQRQAITIDAPKGYVLLTHGGHPLGFVKNLGSRANNLYPKPWRILSQENTRGIDVFSIS
ncbi:MAG: rRNA cytosine-C5-methyltransferase [Muribaculaceae bacterium]|nr:rRNA cytosine-C5-methyltransferase [Muribaculaceae bacterium]